MGMDNPQSHKHSPNLPILFDHSTVFFSTLPSSSSSPPTLSPHHPLLFTPCIQTSHHAFQIHHPSCSFETSLHVDLSFNTSHPMVIDEMSLLHQIQSFFHSNNCVVSFHSITQSLPHSLTTTILIPHSLKSNPLNGIHSLFLLQSMNNKPISTGIIIHLTLFVVLMNTHTVLLSIS